MVNRYLNIDLRRFFDIRPGEFRRVALMATVLCLLLAANNVIKIVRDALFLSRFPIAQLPYVILLAALVAGVVIVGYSRYTAKVALSRVIRGSMVFTISTVISFWCLIVFYNAGWVLYAYYIWSAIAGLVLVSQFWILANGMFNPRDGKRLFGIITAGGTLGAMIGGLAAKWAVSVLFGSEHLLWLVVALIAAAFAVTVVVLKERDGTAGAELANPVASSSAPDPSGVIGTVLGSPYLKTIAALIFVSVIVSTLIDYQFKAAAKAAYPNANALAGFFGSYYAWLGAVTMLAQLWLTGKVLMGLGLTPGLLVLPVALLAGSVSLLIWPGLVAATATRMAEATLRTSVNQSGVQILYLPITDAIKKKVKVLLDVTVERLGDGTAALFILFVAFAFGSAEAAVFLKYVSAGLILMWIAVVLMTQRGYTDALRQSLARREASLELARIDFADRGTVEAVFRTLDERDERAVIFGLDLAAKLDPRLALAHMPRSLLRHPSPKVRSRAVKLLAVQPEPTSVEDITQMLRDEDKEVQAAAVSAAGSILKDGALPLLLPYLEESQDTLVRRRVLECLLLYGDAASRESALSHFVRMVNDVTPLGEPGRIEAARLIGEVYDPAFSGHLERLISEDRSFAVIRAAIAAAARGHYRGVIPNIIDRLGSTVTKNQAREALVQFGETAVQPLREKLFDANAGRDVRINIPRTLSKLPVQSAIDGLLSALGLEDRSIRYKVILALEEMARRFANLTVDREPIERAIVSDAMLYFRRFAIFYVLFGEQDESSRDPSSLLRLALAESMERVKERVMWLLSLVYPSRDIRSVWSNLTSKDSGQRDYAIEFLDNLLAGNIKQHVFPLFSDAPEAQRYKTALASLGMDAIDKEAALGLLLQQDDIWLTAATVWEIGIRRLGAFRPAILTFANSKNAMLRETAALVGERIAVQ